MTANQPVSQSAADHHAVDPEAFKQKRRVKARILQAGSANETKHLNSKSRLFSPRWGESARWSRGCLGGH